MDIAFIPGAGAAGGIGGGLLPFIQAELKSGIDVYWIFFIFVKHCKARILFSQVKGNWMHKRAWVKR